ncbi:hypothetical protein [Clavibacter californiensis]|uniref:Uncharacterized protein n=1 Tax=Clavibacter californiensis TaxID=1401995 RepID=A0ABX9N944_9MICO|nr:hypothetical protein [Clavibacter californiensis]RII94566.1 hypothetical protein DZF98_01215 [Clavibacter californiensis]UKF78904.1 hypothetical protein FGD68_08770 [Clavibacter californiensis]
MSLHRDARSVIASARQALRFADEGAKLFLARGDDADMGLQNAIMNGRRVTFILQNLSNKDLAGPAFTAWYDEEMKDIRASKRDQYFKELRNLIEKQGATGLVVAATITNLSSNTPQPTPPPGAVRRFYGDPLGRSGWDVVLPDGTETVVYSSTPEFLHARLTSADAPDGFNVFEDIRPWLDGLRQLVDRAEARWVTGQ